MGFLIGVVLALGVGVFLTVFRMDRDRATYPVIMIVIALIYELFAVMGGSTQALLIESAIGVAVTIAGFRSTLWLVAAALAGHGIFDLFHGRFIHNPGVPEWWPMFCGAYDVTAAGYLAWLILRNKINPALT